MNPDTVSLSWTVLCLDPPEVPPKPPLPPGLESLSKSAITQRLDRLLPGNNVAAATWSGLSRLLITSPKAAAAAGTGGEFWPAGGGRARETAATAGTARRHSRRPLCRRREREHDGGDRNQN